MDIPINQIWNFIALQSANADKQQYSLHAAHVIMAGLDVQSITELTKKKVTTRNFCPLYLPLEKFCGSPTSLKNHNYVPPRLEYLKHFAKKKRLNTIKIRVKRMKFTKAY